MEKPIQWDFVDLSKMSPTGWYVERKKMWMQMYDQILRERARAEEMAARLAEQQNTLATQTKKIEDLEAEVARLRAQLKEAQEKVAQSDRKMAELLKQLCVDTSVVEEAVSVLAKLGKPAQKAREIARNLYTQGMTTEELVAKCFKEWPD
jgi:septal ring factor EnvC (AmiA/AmiB activator)